MKKISCRDHKGGVFTVTAKRGRPPVRCTEENPCTALRGKEDVSARVLAANTAVRDYRNPSKPTKKELAAKRAAFEASEREASEQRTATKTAEPKFRATEAVKTSHGREKSLELAQKAKAMLSEQGWEVQGSAKGELVTISAHRGEELLSIVWKDGVAIDQNYSLWSVDKPSRNGDVPPHSLPFDPEWATDGEVAAHIVGNKITWWNRISGKEEKGVCGHDTISIEHRFDGAGHEIPSERLIKFLDGAGGNMRLIQLGQLLKVGK